MVSENRIWYLRRSRLFERAGDETIANCEHLFSQKLYRARTLIFEQGDVGRIVYLVKTGKVRLARATKDGKELTIALLGPGDLFGEEVVFSDVVRSSFATCLEESLLCAIAAADLYGLLNRYPVLALNVAKYLKKQRDDAMAIAEDFAYLRVPERLARLFERLSTDHGTAHEEGTLIDVRLTHAEIASLIGCSRETVSTLMMQLVREGRIAMRDNRILLPPSS